MRTITLNGQTFEVPSTAADWGLFANKQGAWDAANELTASFLSLLMEVSQRAHQGYRLDLEGAIKVHDRYMLDIYTRYADVGSLDTEPRSIALYHLERICEALG